MSDSPTKNMNLSERIKHVGGRETTKNGYIEFGSVMAVSALITQAIRDAENEQQEALTRRVQELEKALGYVIQDIEHHDITNPDCKGRGLFCLDQLKALNSTKEG